jgi:hypothetical protein
MSSRSIRFSLDQSRAETASDVRRMSKLCWTGYRWEPNKHRWIDRLHWPFTLECSTCSMSHHSLTQPNPFFFRGALIDWLELIFSLRCPASREICNSYVCKRKVDLITETQIFFFFLFPYLLCIVDRAERNLSRLLAAMPSIDFAFCVLLSFRLTLVNVHHAEEKTSLASHQRPNYNSRLYTLLKSLAPFINATLRGHRDRHRNLFIWEYLIIILLAIYIVFA